MTTNADEQIRADFDAWLLTLGLHLGNHERQIMRLAYQAGRAALQSQDREDAGLAERALQREYYELMAQFEREHHGRFDKEDKALWPKGAVYQDGHVNELFLSFRRGFAYAKCVAYGDGFNDGLKKGFSDGYSDALADVKNKLESLVETAVADLEKEQP